MTLFPHSDALCALPQPYCQEAVPKGLFNLAMSEITRFHAHHTPGYGHWLNAHAIAVDDLDELDDWSQLPPIFASFFKQEMLLSPTGEDALELTSSGTSGQKSRMRYDARSLGAAQYMVERIFAQYGWIAPHAPCNYLLLGYEPEQKNTLGTSFTDQFLCGFAPANRVVYALRRNGNGHQFDLFGVISALQAFAEEGLPVRIFGFPAFLWETLQRMRATGVADLQLPAGSLAFFGGGWKTRAAEEVPQTSPVCTDPATTGHRYPRLSRRLRRRRTRGALRRMRPPSLSCTCLRKGVRTQPSGFFGLALWAARPAESGLALHFLKPGPCRGHERSGHAASRHPLCLRSGQRLVPVARPRRHHSREELCHGRVRTAGEALICT